MLTDEYKFFGNTMENVSIKYGIFLIISAGIISFLSNSQSLTSWIPAFIGFPIFIMGWFSRIMPLKKKLFMHFAVLFGLLGTLGGADFLRSLMSELGAFSNFWADLSKLIMFSSGAFYCVLCIKSFIFARQAREKTPENQ
jgi:hypothetical protein